MYEAYWGLSETAFCLTPDPRFLFLTQGHEDALEMLRYAVMRNKGAAMLTGDIGLGKTTITRKLIESLDPETHKIVLIVNPVLTPNQMLLEILSQMGVKVKSRQRQELVQTLHQAVFDSFQAGQRVVVIVDEAHLIKNTQTFEELRLMLNCQLNDQFLLNLILVGQTELKEKVNKVPALESRMAVRCILRPLDVVETNNMLLHRMQVAGYQGTKLPFTPDAVYQLHKATNGYPRRLLQFADNALLVCSAKRSLMVDAFMMVDIISEFMEAAA